MPPKKGQNSLQEEVQLIDAVRDRPCLWNKLHPDFKNLIKKEAAWLEVGKLLGKEGSGGGRAFFRHEDAMLFLKGTVEPDEENFSNLDDDEENSQMINDEIAIELSSMGSVSQIESTIIPRNKEVPPGRSHAKFGKRKLDEFDKELLGMLKNGQDEYDTYCKTLAEKFRLLGNSDRKRFLELQYSINSLVHEAEMRSLLSG
ncbi:hypothetical protein Fcan01_10520 [Folsomia candida]|uniref:MADF domain-containing protein n=1 Tax=Folsomia candida TaxID=158441 RepID=A0A226EAY4_FOLCA|nr:hypothetical protein Fcan01_10520 [Folsomia candida]